MELELGNDHTGQFFTPSDVSLTMAQMLYGDELKSIEKPFITLSKPACGAGGMVLAFVKVLISHGHNPAEKQWVQCIDVDRLASLMCYLQLSLWNIPAEIVIGNTLTMDFREVLYTPAHYMGCWDMRLQNGESKKLPTQAPTKTPKTDELTSPGEKPRMDSKGGNIQLDFGF